MSRLIIGIAGGTGSGKTTIAEKIADALPADAVRILQHDSYYRDRSGLSPEVIANINFDHPDALETSLLVDQLRELRAGRGVDVPVYDFTTHTRSRDTRRVDPAPVLIVEGILVFVDAALRELMDVKLFVDTADDIRVFRRIRRDMQQRGRSFRSIREQYYKTVRPMHVEFVVPSKRFADLVIPEGGNNDVALDVIIGKLRNYP